jgi:polyprenyl-phospho-N-acetylgalactosaminyl synthase
LKTFIIIPAFNEASYIGEVILSLLTLRQNIIVVDDGSSDATSQVVSDFPVTLLRHDVNLGQGAALETGMEAARLLSADAVVHFDADGQHDASDIKQLLDRLQFGETDIVFGSRFMGKSASGISWHRKIVLRAGRWINFLLTGILLTDAHNGIRALNKKALHCVHFGQPGMAHATEILYIIRRKNLRYEEMPVHIRYTAHSKRKGQHVMNSINILFHLLFKRN